MVKLVNGGSFINRANLFSLKTDDNVDIDVGFNGDVEIDIGIGFGTDV